jgi:hypothetical protein
VGFVDDILGPLVRAPSKTTKPKMANAIMEIVQTIGKLEQASFLPLPDQNLCTFIDESVRYERSLAEYYRLNYKTVYKKNAFKCDTVFVRLAVEGNRLEALERLLDSMSSFASIVSSEDTILHKVSRATKYQRHEIAEAVYSNSLGRREQATPRQLFEGRRSRYMLVLGGLDLFRNSHVASLYIEGRYLSYRIPKEPSQRREVVNSVFQLAGARPPMWNVERVHDLARTQAHVTLLSFLVDQYNSTSMV